MRYVLLIYDTDENRAKRTPEENGAMMAAYGALEQELAPLGIKAGGEALEGTDKATTVRVRNGKPLLTDGPFAETKERLGGFYILDCANLDEALKWAAKIPSAKFGSVEIRPIWDYRQAMS
jgi:hypothetical protein